MPASLAEILAPWLKTKPRGKRLWSGNWSDDAAAMLRQDLAVAKIEYLTDAGYFDFHAARHTGITRGSAIMRIDKLKSFARHAKVETTMRYIHTDADELRGKVDLLSPWRRSRLGSAATTAARESSVARKKSDHE